MKYTLKPTRTFIKKYKKLVKGNDKLKKIVGDRLDNLRDNPKIKKLNSHKVSTSKFGSVWSLRITGDIRVLWNYDEQDQIVLLLLDIGGHDQVYL